MIPSWVNIDNAAHIFIVKSSNLLGGMNGDINMPNLRLLQAVSIIIWLLLSMSWNVSAQSYYDQIIDQAEERVRQNRPNFRLIRTHETFPERISADQNIWVETVPSGGIVAIHDPHSGEPFDACKAPCSLALGRGRSYVFVGYKSGYFFTTVEEDAAGWKEHYENTPLTLGLGPNVRAHYNKSYFCSRTWETRKLKDQDIEVCSRVPGLMPADAETSGHCYVQFDVTSQGRTKNIRAINCTDPVFEAASIKAVKLWVYYPKVEYGAFVDRPDVESKISFKLQDLNGTLIPEP